MVTGDIRNLYIVNKPPGDVSKVYKSPNQNFQLSLCNSLFDRLAILVEPEGKSLGKSGPTWKVDVIQRLPVSDYFLGQGI